VCKGRHKEGGKNIILTFIETGGSDERKEHEILES